MTKPAEDADYASRNPRRYAAYGFALGGLAVWATEALTGACAGVGVFG